MLAEISVIPYQVSCHTPVESDYKTPPLNVKLWTMSNELYDLHTEKKGIVSLEDMRKYRITLQMDFPRKYDRMPNGFIIFGDI